MLFIGGVRALCVVHMGDQFETSAMAHAFTKIVFTLLIIAHVIVWPSAWSIFATAAYAALVGGQLMRISMARDQENKAYFAALAKPGILLFQVRAAITKMSAKAS